MTTKIRKILILVGQISSNKETLTRHLKDKLSGSADVTLANISDLYFDIDQKNVYVEINGTPITDFDLVYFRSVGTHSVLAATLSICLTSLKINFMDTIWAEIRPVGNKFTSLVKLAIDHLPIFRSIYIAGNNVEKNKGKIVDKLGLPLIAKELSTQRGRGVYKIAEVADFDKLPEKENMQYLFQEFVDFDTEYRLLVLGEDVRVWEKKVVTAPGEFRHNVSLGATEEFLAIKKIPQELKELAIKSAKSLGLQVAGVDISIEKQGLGYHLIEVNRGPGFTYDDKLSTEMDELAKFLDREANKK
jgi:glutathione synthase/RimK-type ligase-like ATP-grasp enzyme